MFKLLDQWTTQVGIPLLTGKRIAAALAVAIVADFLQIILLPLQTVFAQQVIDVLAMALIIPAVGFHPLLLPTFVAEFIPIVDVLPTWTGCVIAVIALRKRAQKIPQPPVNDPRAHVIDVESQRIP